jgi:hypothetical protein
MQMGAKGIKCFFCDYGNEKKTFEKTYIQTFYYYYFKE